MYVLDPFSFIGIRRDAIITHDMFSVGFSRILIII